MPAVFWFAWMGHPRLPQPDLLPKANSAAIKVRRAGTDDSLPPVVIGSHLDTQVNGGRYDGIVGVLER